MYLGSLPPNVYKTKKKYTTYQTLRRFAEFLVRIRTNVCITNQQRFINETHFCSLVAATVVYKCYKFLLNLN